MRTSLAIVGLTVNVRTPGASNGFGIEDLTGNQFNLAQGPRKALVQELLRKLTDALANNRPSIEVETRGLQIVPDPIPPSAAAAVVLVAAAPASGTVVLTSTPAPTSGPPKKAVMKTKATPKRRSGGGSVAKKKGNDSKGRKRGS